MVLAHLHRIEVKANMARFYTVDVVPNLFGEISVMRNWGRIGTYGRASVQTCASTEEAERAASLTLRQKMRRAYLPTLQLRPPYLAD